MRQRLPSGDSTLVVKLHAELKEDFRWRLNHDLEIFFDKEDIKDFDHGQARCHRALRDSRFFIARHRNRAVWLDFAS